MQRQLRKTKQIFDTKIQQEIGFKSFDKVIKNKIRRASRQQSRELSKYTCGSKSIIDNFTNISFIQGHSRQYSRTDDDFSST